MRWHIELLFEVALFAVLVSRNTGLRWFDLLIGIDLTAQILQIIPYRSGYPQFSRLFWQSGVILIAAARFMALIEAGSPPEKNRRNWAHARILAFWTASATACAFLMVGQPDSAVHHINTALMIIQAASFLAWIAVFINGDASAGRSCF